MKSSLFLCFCLSISLVSTTNTMDTCYDEELQEPGMPYEFGTPRRTSYTAHLCTWKYFCAYGVPTIAVISTLGLVSVLGYNWMNPTVTIAAQDLQLLQQLLNQTSPLIKSTKLLLPKADALLDQSITLIKQANENVPAAKKLLEQAENLYPYADYAVHKIINITQQIEHILGKI